MLQQLELEGGGQVSHQLQHQHAMLLGLCLSLSLCVYYCGAHHSLPLSLS